MVPDTSTNSLDYYYNEEVPKASNPFTGKEYSDRRDKVIKEMERRDLDAVVLSSPESQCWLHGYQARWYRTGSTTAWPPVNFTVVIRETGAMFVIDTEDHRRLFTFTSILPDHPEYFRPPTSPDPSLDAVHGHLAEQLRREGVLFARPSASGQATPGRTTRLGIEKWSPRQNAATTSHLVALLSDKHTAVVEDVSISMRTLQRRKSTEEINVMRTAGKYLDIAYSRLEKGLHANMTEMEVWAELELAMAAQGGETAGLHNTVSRARPYYHALSSTRPIGSGPIHADPCAVLHRYHVNTARAFFIESDGVEMPKSVTDASKIAADALQVLLGVAKPGVAFAEVSKELRTHYQSRPDLWDKRDWIGGYQLGISFTPDWVGEFIWNVDAGDEEFDHITHDPEDIPQQKEEKVIEDGLVTNFESYVGGVGFIDTIVFTKEQGAETLSGRPRTMTPIPERP